MAEPKMSRQEILDFIEQNWTTYLATLDALPEDELQAFAREHGYPSAKELIAHIAGWWREAVRRIGAIMAGQEPTTDYANDDEFNARMIEGVRGQTYEQVKEDFENARVEIAGLVAELPDAALNNPQIYDEIEGEVVGHYYQHTPPGDPQIPAERYGGEHPA
jgi:hypothetical protein